MRSRMKSDERRAAIVAAAIRLFSEKGFRGATTRELAGAMGVTEPVLYQHFETKRELYSAIIETRAHQIDEKTADLAVLVEVGDDRRFFTRFAELILDRYDEHAGFMRLLLFSALERHELADMFYRSQAVRTYEIAVTYIQRRMDEGDYRHVDPQVTARGFIGMIGHHGLIQMLFNDEIVKMNRAQYIDEMVTMFLEGVCQR